MKARITKSTHAEVRDGTIGDVLGKSGTGLIIKVRGMFTVPAATPRQEECDREIYVEAADVELITENDPSGMGIVLCQALDWLCEQSHSNAVDKGFWEHPRNDGELLCLIHSEVSECLEAMRHGNPASEHIPAFSAAEEEAADAFIRFADMARARGWRLGEAILAKMAFNATRPPKHGKQF